MLASSFHVHCPCAQFRRRDCFGRIYIWLEKSPIDLFLMLHLQHIYCCLNFLFKYILFSHTSINCRDALYFNDSIIHRQIVYYFIWFVFRDNQYCVGCNRLAVVDCLAVNILIVNCCSLFNTRGRNVNHWERILLWTTQFHLGFAHECADVEFDFSDLMLGKCSHGVGDAGEKLIQTVWWRC